MNYSDGRKMGPKMLKLVTMRMSVLAVPNGTKDPLAAALDMFTTPGRMAEHCRIAITEMETALKALRAAPDEGARYRAMDDEAIAEELLQRAAARRVEERKR